MRFLCSFFVPMWILFVRIATLRELQIQINSKVLLPSYKLKVFKICHPGLTTLSIFLFIWQSGIRQRFLAHLIVEGMSRNIFE